MRILLLSDPIWLQPPSGYSKIADMLSLRFNKDGHTVAHIPIDSGIRGTSQLKGHAMTWKNTLLLEGGPQSDIMSESVVLKHYYDFKADFILTFKDIWNFRVMRDLPVNWIPVVPIEHAPVSQEVTYRLQTTFQNISITRFGKRELMKANMPSTYIPLFVDTNLYQPMNQTQAREYFGLPPDCFGILIVAMNRRRKMIPRMLEACKRFLDNNPDATKTTKIILWLSLTPEAYSQDGATGTMLSPKIRQLDLSPYIFVPDAKLYENGLPEHQMPLLYNTGNCILCASAEGFWLPGVEAGSCAVPSVCVEWAASPEVTTGELAKVQDWDVMNPLGYDQPLVDRDSMAEGIAKIYNGDPERYARDAREYALKYDVATVYTKYWKPFLAKIDPQLRPLVTSEGIRSWKLA